MKCCTLVLVATMVSCTGKVIPTPEPPPPTTATTIVLPEVVVSPEASCDTACSNQRLMGCELGRPTPKGASCEEVCENSSKTGIPELTWDKKRLTSATECD